MRVIAVVIGAGWLAFWVYWLAAASRAQTAGRPRLGRFAGVPVVVLVLLLARDSALRGGVVHRNAALGAAGALLCLAGWALAIWARRNLGANWGMPMSVRVEPQLVTSGPYRWIRNPIYTGLILAMVGTALALSLVWLVVVAVLGGYFVYAGIAEEHTMAEAFPDAYPVYRRSTKRFVPFLF